MFGPGPVAETFPNAMAPLELDLWVEPMREALREVLRISGGAAAKKVAASPIIVEVNGHVAADLQLLGIERPTGARSLLARIDPRPPVRRLKVAWQVGRLPPRRSPAWHATLSKRSTRCSLTSPSSRSCRTVN